jgi:hypothetical protein
MNERQNRGPRERSWLLVLTGAVAAVAPTVLALLSRGTRLPFGLNEVLIIWLWGLGALVAAILAIAALLTCPWRATAKAAIWLGWSSIVAAASVTPATAYSLAHWSQYPPSQTIGIVRAGGMVRDMTVDLALSCAAVLVGGASVLVARRRRGNRSA